MRQKRADKSRKVVRTDKAIPGAPSDLIRLMSRDGKPLRNQSLTASGQVVRGVVRSCPETVAADNTLPLGSSLSGCPVSGVRTGGEAERKFVAAHLGEVAP